jgi:hypothetical protein
MWTIVQLTPAHHMHGNDLWVEDSEVISFL